MQTLEEKNRRTQELLRRLLEKEGKQQGPVKVRTEETEGRKSGKGGK